MKKLIPVICMSFVIILFIYITIYGHCEEEPDEFYVLHNNSNNDSGVRNYENDYYDFNFRFDGFRIGPIILLVDKEWLIDGKYLNIGLSKEDVYSKDYDIISPKSKSVETTEAELYPKESDNDKYMREVDIYKIDFSKKKMWLDINLIMLSYYDKTTKTIVYNFTGEKKFFIFHPLHNKWWGIHYLTLNENEIVQVMNTKLYKETNTKNDIEKLLIKSQENLTKEKIIAERTLVIPSYKFYQNKFDNLIEKYKLYSWYVEKEEVAPKDEDE